MEINKKAIAENILQYRLKANITQKELAQKTKLSRNYISILENSKDKAPSIKTLDLIANALNIRIDQLLFENLDYFTKNSGELIIDKELSCLNITELNIILSMLRIYNDNHYKLL